MSSDAALGLLNDPQLKRLLTATPGMHDSFTALMESVIARREKAGEKAEEDLTKLKKGIDDTEQEEKYTKLETVYVNHSAKVKRLFARVVYLNQKLAKSVSKVSQVAPSNLVKDEDNPNPRNIFVAASKLEGGPKIFGKRILAESGDKKKLTTAMKAFKEATLELCEDLLEVETELGNIEAERVAAEGERATLVAAITGSLPAGDPRVKAIVDARESLAKLEEEFLKDIVGVMPVTTDVPNVRTQLERLEHKVYSGKDLWPRIGNLIAQVGYRMFELAVFERDFLNEQKAPGEGTAGGILLKDTRKLLNDLKTYESKVFGNIHDHVTPSDTNLGNAFTSYATRQTAIIGASKYAATKVINATFKNDSAPLAGARAERIRSELTAPI
tara:strand:+ start:1344 stop:2501 length:1158 start_codon:yes stop_codon:yes gene_type:complete